MSLKRLQRFLDNDELDNEAVEHSNSASQLYASCVCVLGLGGGGGVGVCVWWGGCGGYRCVYACMLF